LHGLKIAIPRTKVAYNFSFVSAELLWEMLITFDPIFISWILELNATGHPKPDLRVSSSLKIAQKGFEAQACLGSEIGSSADSSSDTLPK
jgi:hypothetical protein